MAERRWTPERVAGALRRRATRILRPGDPLWYQSHRIGELWEEVGKLQFDFLVSAGLSPASTLLDVGCGSLRGGRHYVRYLEPGHYVGVDRDPKILEAGEEVLRQEELSSKDATLVALDRFQFDRIGRTFDFAVAVSVFTHLTINSIVRCLHAMEQVLVPGGKFYASFFEGADGRFDLTTIPRPEPTGKELATTFDANPFHYSVEIFEWICEAIPLSVRCIGDWNHPRDQKMLVFTKDPHTA